MNTAPTQTEAQRLADSISRMDTFTEHQRSEIQQAAALLRRQYELLKKALCVLERVHHTTDADRAAAADAIRNHLEAK